MRLRARGAGLLTLQALLGAAALGVTTPATATNVLEFPDNGSEQMQRGGAWVARASDPLATFFNPAGLAGQATRLTLQANLTAGSTCFTRVKAANDTTQEPLADPATGRFPEVCEEGHFFPNPQLAFAYRAHERVGVGLAVLGPSAVGDARWPSFVKDANGPQPAPQRYMISGNGRLLLLMPTLGVGVEPIDGLRLGASFSWGIMKARFPTASPALNADNLSPRGNDVQATLIAADYFVPSVNLGAIYSPIDQLDLAGWFRWSDAIKARGDAYSQANYYTPAVANGDTSGIKDGDTSLRDCNTGTPGSTLCGDGNNASIKMVQPLEAKLGVRYHKPRVKLLDPETGKARHTRDPISDDYFDVEIDGTWANNSAIRSLEVRFPGDANGDGIIPANGTPGNLPPNADITKNYKDVFGIRIGGDVNVLPDQFALRAGGFWESTGQNPTYQNIDFSGAARLGLAFGGTYRIRFDKEKTRALDLMLGFMHVFFAKQANDDPSSEGLHALAGSACNPADHSTPGPTCTDGRQKYRTNWPINLGTLTRSVNVINVGASYRF